MVVLPLNVAALEAFNEVNDPEFAAVLPIGGGEANRLVNPAPEIVLLAERVVNAPVLGVVLPIDGGEANNEVIPVPETVLLNTLVPVQVLAPVNDGILEIATPLSLTWVPEVLFQVTILLTTDDPGPVIVPAAENALGGAGEPDRLPQRVLGGKTPVHWAQAGLESSASTSARMVFMGILSSIFELWGLEGGCSHRS
jgi:hypothetical protein